MNLNTDSLAKAKGNSVIMCMYACVCVCHASCVDLS